MVEKGNSLFFYKPQYEACFQGHSVENLGITLNAAQCLWRYKKMAIT